MNPIFFRLGFLLFFSLQVSANTSTSIHYPRPESLSDERLSYPISLLKLCLAKSGETYDLHPTNFHMQQGRSIKMLEAGKELDVLWTVSSIEREDKLLPIRIPIDRGLIGWRLLLISAKNQQLFTPINSAIELGKLRAGQGHDWPDYDVLKKNNFSVSPSPTYEGLFKMLSEDHIQYFPRGINEVWREINSHPNIGLIVEPRLVLHYPQSLYFFVNKNNTSLAAAIERGLKAAMADGSFKALFNEHYRKNIEFANFSSRTIISIDNPVLPASVPLDKKNYWFSPGEIY